MKATDLRIGNWTFNNVENYQVTGEDIGYLSKGDNIHMASPIPLSEQWLVKLPEGLKYPEWIVSVHELQNWYFWNHNKKELVFTD